jgi:hypothetical protein
MSCLERAYYVSQIILTAIAGVAAIGAYLQLQAQNKIEMLKLLEAPHVRKARRLLHKKLVESEAPAKWWQFDDDLEEAASTVCASFDIVGIMAWRLNRRFFANEWSHPICWTFKVLKDYIDARNPGGYHGYRRLHEEVTHRRHPRQPASRARS